MNLAFLPVSSPARPRSYLTSPFIRTVLLAAVAVSPAVLAAETGNEPVPAQTQNAVPGYFPGVHHLTGIPDTKPGSGKLWISTQGIGFETGGNTKWIHADWILKTSLGDERYLPGGEFARYLRTGFAGSDNPLVEAAAASGFFAVIPFGALLEVTALNRLEEDILTVEFLDPKDGYHTAVFTLPGRHDHKALSRLLPPANPELEDEFRLTQSAAANCEAGSAKPASITLQPLQNEGSELPAEYRALIYERVFRKLRKSEPNLEVLRKGSSHPSSNCNGWNLNIAAGSFHKGDAVGRALLGPAGLFVGTTSLQYQLQITNNHGDSILDAPARTVVRGDRESLDLTKSLAASVNRKVKKLERGISN